MADEQVAPDPQYLSIVNFRGGIDTYNHYSAIQNPAIGRDIRNATLLDGTLKSRKTLSNLYAVNGFAYSVFETVYNKNIYTFYTTSTGLYLNGEILDADIDKFVTMFYYRDYVYILNKQKFLRYDLQEKVLRNAGLEKIIDRPVAFLIQNYVQANGLILHEMNSTTNLTKTGSAAALVTDNDIAMSEGTSVKQEIAAGEVAGVHGITVTINTGGQLDFDTYYDEIPLAYRVISGFIYTTVDVPKSSFQMYLNSSAGSTGVLEVRSIPANTWTYWRMNLDDFLDDAVIGSFDTADWDSITLQFEEVSQAYDIYYDRIQTNVFIHPNNYPTTSNLVEQASISKGPMKGDYFYAITAIDRYGLESQAGQFYNEGSRVIPDEEGLITTQPDYPESTDVALIAERVPYSMNWFSALIDGSQNTTLATYIANNSAVDKFRIYRKGGSATGWRYVGDWTLENSSSNTAGSFSGAGAAQMEYRAYGEGFSDQVVTIEIVDGTASPNTYRWNVDGGAWSGTINAHNIWGRLIGTPLWIRFLTLTDHTTGDTWTINVTNNNQQPFWDDNEDSALTVLGTWTNNASIQDRKTDVLFFDDITGRLWLGFGPYLYYSESSYPDNVPYVNFIQLPTDIVNITRDALSIIVKTRTATYRVSGNIGELETTSIIGGTGAVTPWSSALIRGLCFTYSDGRITGIDAGSANFAVSQAMEVDIGLGLYDFLVTVDPEATASYNPITRESILIHDSILYYGQADNMKMIEFTRDDQIEYKSAQYSFARDTMLFAGDGGIYLESDEDAEYTWTSVEKDHGIPYVHKDIKNINAVYTGDLTVNIYTDGELAYTKVLPNHTSKKREFFRPPSKIRGILIQYELIGTGSVESFTAEVNTLNPV